MTSPIVSRIPSGINEIDQLWSGLYRGGTYLVYGRTADGRSLLPLMYAHEGCKRNEKCLLVATDRPRSLVIHSSLIGFDIKEANRNDLLKLVRFPTLSESRGISDDVRADTLAQLVELVKENLPTRLIINDLTPFVQFESFDRFRSEMVSLLDNLDDLNVTSVIALPEPANVHSERVVAYLKSQVVGSIHVQRNVNRDTESFTLSLIPNVGHITKEFTVDWQLEKVVDSNADIQGAGREIVSSSDAGNYTKQDLVDQPSTLKESKAASTPADSIDAAINESDSIEKSASDDESDPVDIVEQWHASLPRVDSLVAEYSIDDKSLGDESIHEGDEPSILKRVDDEEDEPAAKAPTSPEDVDIAVGSEHDMTHPDILMPTSVDSADESIANGDKSDDQVPDEYESQIISELNRELIGLVQPFEIVTPESRQGAINPEIHENPSSFASAADFYFDNYQRDAAPFLLIGIRLDRTKDMIPRKFDFEFVAEITQKLLRSYDALLIDSERQHLVILLADAEQKGAEAFFRRLRAKLLDEAPNQATHLMQSVSAIVAVNGEGFSSTDDFLKYIGESR